MALSAEFFEVARRIGDLIKRTRAGKPLTAADQAFVGRLTEAPAALPTYASSADCSGQTKIPISFLKQARRQGCPAFHASNRVDLAVLIVWMFRPDAGEADDGTDWSNELKKWLAKRAKIAHDRDAKLVLPLDQAEAEIQTGLGILFGQLDVIFCNELPAAIRGLDAPAIRTRVAADIERLKEACRSRLLGLVEADVEAIKPRKKSR